MKTLSKTKDLTQGPITRELLLFMLPLLAGSLIQQMYNTVDLIFIGQFAGKEAAAAVGSGSLLVTCMIGFFTGMGTGVGILVSRFFAGKEEDQVRQTIHCTAALVILFSISLTLIGIVLTPWFLRLMHTPESILIEGVRYLRIYLLSLFSIVTYNLGAGILRALGNSRAPMYYQLIGGIVNILGNTLFIYVLRLGVTGAAFATACSQTLAALLVIHALCRLPQNYRLRFKSIRLDPQLSVRIFKLGIPAAVQAITMTLSNLVLQSCINRMGVESIAAFTAYFKIENLIYLPILAFGQTASTFTSQNLGAGAMDRIRKGTKVSIWMGVSITVALSAIVLSFSGAFFSLFSKDAEVIRLGEEIARVAYTFYFLYVFLEVYSSVIRGAGKTLVSMIIALSNLCGLRLFLLFWIMRLSPDAVTVAMVYPLTWASTAFCMFLYYRSGKWCEAFRKPPVLPRKEESFD
ncbi:MAG: MATE family efflux transporter [Eubacteriales bacterium]|nr:MATE family efflux transporter [Eubacteriales bacterium]